LRASAGKSYLYTKLSKQQCIDIADLGAENRRKFSYNHSHVKLYETKDPDHSQQKLDDITVPPPEPRTHTGIVWSSASFPRQSFGLLSRIHVHGLLFVPLVKH